MSKLALGIGAATLAWFITAAVLFFNPIVDKIYRSEEEHPAVRTLPQSGKTIGMILLAVVLQCAAWAYVFMLIAPALPGSTTGKALMFGLVIVLMKIFPRDIDRLLLTTYPKKRMTIEVVVGIVCAFVVGFAFAYLL